MVATDEQKAVAVDMSKDMLKLADRMDYLISLAKNPLEHGEVFEPGPGLEGLLESLRHLTTKVGKLEKVYGEVTEELEDAVRTKDEYSELLDKSLENTRSLRHDVELMAEWFSRKGLDPTEIRGQFWDKDAEERVRELWLAYGCGGRF